MDPRELHFSRDFDLPVAVVWDALVDEVLVEGWLAVARIEPKLGGLYWLDWQSAPLAPTNGTITVLDAPTTQTRALESEAPEARSGESATLGIETDNIGTLLFQLSGMPGGPRGSNTHLELTITVDTERRLLASTRAYWLSNFDQLEELLRGHPVDWGNWQRDRGDAWAAYLRDASGPI